MGPMAVFLARLLISYLDNAQPWSHVLIADAQLGDRDLSQCWLPLPAPKLTPTPS